MKRKLYSIVIPVYGTSKSLIEIAERIKAVFQNMPDNRYELLFVNDSSPNTETATTLQQIYQNDSNVSIISFTKNFGQQAATLCGIHHANGDYIITMDDDLQHKPEDIPKLMQSESHDVVIATFPIKKHPLPRRIASRCKGWFDRIILKKPKHIKLTAFRLINRCIADGLKDCQTPYPFISAMLFRITADIKNVTLQHQTRLEGHSQYTIWKMIGVFSNLIINNSYLLLRILGFIGMGGFLLSIAFSAYLIIRYYFYGFGVTGWASLILSVVFFGGLTLFGIGVIGDYLLRILANLEQKNMYYIKQIHKH
jgi:dolichol-phosphate mannosyltransferase/undecaprenyl-phosphate 4-deoxy-4-formamido-L-arabinose transferase